MIKIMPIEKILEKIADYFTQLLDNEIDHTKHAIKKDIELSNSVLETKHDSISNPQHEKNYNVYRGMFYW